MIRKCLVLTIVMFLAACGTVSIEDLPFNIGRLLPQLRGELQQKQVFIGDPVFIRIIKEENILEVWMKPDDSYRYVLVKTYPICKWAGYLGPKLREGDFQSPEGFYSTNLRSLNPNSQYHLSFNIQYPNQYDRAHGRTGTYLMIHGDCVSEGCYAMTDDKMEEIYLLVERALNAGQGEVPIHIFPFRMTRERMALEQHNRWYDFWLNIKEGYDYFEQHGVPPSYIVLNKRYDFF